MADGAIADRRRCGRGVPGLPGAGFRGSFSPVRRAELRLRMPPIPSGRCCLVRSDSGRRRRLGHPDRAGGRGRGDPAATCGSPETTVVMRCPRSFASRSRSGQFREPQRWKRSFGLAVLNPGRPRVGVLRHADRDRTCCGRVIRVGCSRPAEPEPPSPWWLQDARGPRISRSCPDQRFGDFVLAAFPMFVFARCSISLRIAASGSV